MFEARTLINCRKPQWNILFLHILIALPETYLRTNFGGGIQFKRMFSYAFNACMHLHFYGRSKAKVSRYVR